MKANITDKVRVNLFLDPGIVRRAKAEAINQGTSLSQLVDKALDSFVPKVIRIVGNPKDMKVEFIKPVFKMPYSPKQKPYTDKKKPYTDKQKQYTDKQL